MGNRIIKHCYDCAPKEVDRDINVSEADKSKSISQLSMLELQRMFNRLRAETDIQNLIMTLKRNAGERDSYEKPFEVDTKTAINQLYHSIFENEPDKSKSISDLTQEEMWRMLDRLRTEVDVQRLIKELKRNSGDKDTLENPFIIDTTTPIDQLYHYGIMGMKWGRRRFQNADGSRTSAGKKRDRRHGRSEDYVTSRKAQKHGPEGLSNEQLRKLNERLKLEDDYKKLTTAKMEKAESWVHKAITNGAQGALSELTKGVLSGTAKTLVKQISPDFAKVAFNTKDK